jgi:phosphatidylglycerol lysyltransferase
MTQEHLPDQIAAKTAEALASPARSRWYALKPWLVPIIAIVLGALVFDALHAVLAEVDYASVVAATMAVAPMDLALSLFFTALSYLILTGYDASSLHYAGAVVKKPTVLLTSFVAYALGNTVGLGVLTGGTVRMRMYAAAGVEPSKIARAIAFNAGAFGLGMTAFGAVGLLWGARETAELLHVSVLLIRALAIAVIFGVAGFVWLCSWRRELVIAGRWHVKLPLPGLAIRQLVISAADLSAAAAALWFLLPANVVDLPTFVAFYALAMALGVISHVPGGLGVFEAVILLACGGRAPADEIAGALILYRGIYFLLPLLVATVMLVSFEARRSTAAPRVARAAVRLTPGLLAAVTSLSGIMLMVSGVTPTGDDAANELLALQMPLFLVEAAHLIGSVAGVAMLFVARGLVHRLDAAWWSTLILAVLAAILAVPKGIAVTEAGMLGFLTILLLVSRKQFYRRSSLFTQTFEKGWLVAVACVLAACAWVLFFAYRDVDYVDRMWWQFAFDANASRSMRALMAAAMFSLALGLWQLFRQPSGSITVPDVDALARAAEVVRKQAAADACLALMGDKSLLFSPSGKSFIMYGKQGRSWIALSDPVGESREWPELIWRFIEMADAHGGRAAFYKARPQTLPMYLDAGLRAYKLGEDAYVALPEFSLQGPRRANLRHGVSRGEREGLTFEIVEQPDVPGVLEEIRAVSNAWLAKHEAREKGFSLGAFDDEYILRQPVAVVRQHGRAVAFATLMSPEVLRVEVTVDLMRQAADAPAGTMDFLFAKLMLHFKALGYQRFGLGMSPMSGMTSHQLAPRWHRFGRLMFQYGERFYNFRGLRSFKDKFDPVWEARYLVTPGGLAPLFVMADTAALIGGGLKGVIAK